MIDISSPDWMAQLVEASNRADIKSVFGDDTTTISMNIGKKSCVFSLSGGRVIEVAADTEAAVNIPLTTKQLTGLVDGSIHLSKAYMQGDIKPVGSSRALMYAIELFDHKQVQNHLEGLLDG